MAGVEDMNFSARHILQRKRETRRAASEAFDTLFNNRDYAAAERLWSPNYIQHSAHIALGREGLFNLIKSILRDGFTFANQR